MPEHPPAEPAQHMDVAALLREMHRGEMEVVGRLRGASNATLFATIDVSGGRGRIPVVYKPRRGERPLWDFPHGTLANREVASYVLSEALGWRFVPPTILRDGPVGPGSVQLFVDVDPAIDLIDFVEDGAVELQPMAVFDILANNADRKVGHCLVDTEGTLWGIDHGLTFNEDHKLRTVLWHWMGDPVPDDLLDDVRRVAAAMAEPDSDVSAALCGLLHPAEIAALRERTRVLLRDKRFPEPDPYGPALPWPPY